MEEQKFSFSHNQPEYTVSSLSSALKRTVEDVFSYVKVNGEVTGFKRVTSGHAYFRLKDNDAVLDGVCWRGNFSKISFPFEDGIEVTCIGKITTYKGRSTYQIVVDKVELAGQGALMALLEKRKKKLRTEGLFEQIHKKTLPKIPKNIAVITSPTGAAIQDILHRISERFPTRVLLYPVQVQGEKAKDEISSAIKNINNIKNRIYIPDIIIIARGGGSLEDLWAFNEEKVVRATFESTIPIISAVGHETDTTLIDYVADLRAPTPSAAAEIVVPVKSELLTYLQNNYLKLFNLINRSIVEKERNTSLLTKAILHPKTNIENLIQKIDYSISSLDNCFEKILYKKTNLINNLVKKILSPNQILGLMQNKLKFITESYTKIIKYKFKILEDSHSKLLSRFSHKNTITKIEANKTKLLKYNKRSKDLIKFYLDRLEEILMNKDKIINGYDYRNVMKRGYALVRNENGNYVNNYKSAKKSQKFKVSFYDGELDVKKIGKN